VDPARRPRHRGWGRCTGRGGDRGSAQMPMIGAAPTRWIPNLRTPRWPTHHEGRVGDHVPGLSSLPGSSRKASPRTGEDDPAVCDQGWTRRTPVDGVGASSSDNPTISTVRGRRGWSAACDLDSSGSDSRPARPGVAGAPPFRIGAHGDGRGFDSGRLRCNCSGFATAVTLGPSRPPPPTFSRLSNSSSSGSSSVRSPRACLALPAEYW
jgi:hypothetical protein